MTGTSGTPGILFLVLAGVPASRSNQRLHWTARSRQDNAVKQNVWLRGVEARLGRGWNPAVKGDRRQVHITAFRVRLLDVDNRNAAVKPYVDGLKTLHGKGLSQRAGAGLIYDDDEDHLDLIVDQRKVAHFVDQYTTILVRKLP